MKQKTMTQEEIDMMALDLMEQHVTTDQPDEQVDQASLHQSFDELQQIRTILQRQAKPVDVEERLKTFHKKHHARLDEYGAADYPRRRNTLYRSIGLTLLAAAAAALALFIMRPAPQAEQPLAKGVVYQAGVQRYISVTQANGRAVALKGNSNNVVLQPENYILDNQRNKDVKITVPHGNSADIELPDGSVAYVHTGGEISFYPVYVEGKRIVELKGEAYFKVKRDEAHPFIVVANHVETTVLGTEFNINTEAESGTAVTLITGSVEVKAGTQKKRITPGTQAVASTNALTVKHVDLQPYINWRDGFFYFDNVELRDIMTAIGKTYNLTVKFNNEKTLHYKTHFVADRTKGIQEVIDMINRMEKIKVHILDNTLVVD